MGTTLAVARREFRSFFNSPVAYIVIGVFLVVAGWLYFSTVFVAGQASLRAFFSIARVLFVVFAPAVTMRLVAEERKSGTLELLLSMPLRDWEVVAGKFLAALGEGLEAGGAGRRQVGRRGEGGRDVEAHRAPVGTGSSRGWSRCRRRCGVSSRPSCAA